MDEGVRGCWTRFRFRVGGLISVTCYSLNLSYLTSPRLPFPASPLLPHVLLLRSLRYLWSWLRFTDKLMEF